MLCKCLVQMELVALLLLKVVQHLAFSLAKFLIIKLKFFRQIFAFRLNVLGNFQKENSSAASKTTEIYIKVQRKRED